MSYENEAVKNSVEWVNAHLVGKTIKGAEMADSGSPVAMMRLLFEDGSKCLIMSEYDEGWHFDHEGGGETEEPTEVWWCPDHQSVMLTMTHCMGVYLTRNGDAPSCKRVRVAIILLDVAAAADR